MTVITLIGDDGNETKVETAAISRIRGILPAERALHEASTRIDQAFIQFVRDAPRAVADLVKPGFPALTELALPNGAPVWFDGSKAKGPLPVPLSEAPRGTRSALTIGNKTQFVSSSPQEVHDRIAAARGTALPVPDPARRTPQSASPELQEWLAPENVWDADVPTE